MPIKNWKGVGHIDYTAKSASKTSDESVLKHQKRKYACQNCLLACGGVIDLKKGRYQSEKGHKPEYETLGAFGGLLLNDDLDAILEINEMCTHTGIDTISTGVTVAFAEDSKISDRAIGQPPLTRGPLQGVTIDTENLFAEFYKTVS